MHNRKIEARALRLQADRDFDRRGELMWRALQLDPSVSVRLRRPWALDPTLPRDAGSMEYWCTPCEQWEVCGDICR